jgi:hypothetical protein
MLARAFGTAFLLIAAAAALSQTAARELARASNDVLILVEPDRFDPAVDPATFIHPTWIRWPEPSMPNLLSPGAGAPSSGGDSRLLSIMSGVDWTGALPLAQFGSDGRLRQDDFERLVARGYFRARAANMRGVEAAMLVGPSSAVATRAMLLALNSGSPRVEGVAISDAWPAGKLVVFKANGGADITAVVRRTTGRVLVAEYPPRAAEVGLPALRVGARRGPNWSRFWMLGRAWEPAETNLIPQTAELGVPGLVAAKDLARLVLRPADFAWKPVPAGWTGANRWFVFVQSSRGPILVGLFLALIVVTVMAAALAGQEKRSQLVCVFARALFLAPAALVLGGQFGRFGGLSGSLVWFGSAWLVLVGIAAIVNLAASRLSEWEPLVGIAAAGFVPLLMLDPRYSVLGNVFEHGPPAFPGEAFGALLGAFTVLAMMVAARSVRLPGSGLLLAGAIAFIFDACAVFLRPWWSNGTLPFGGWWLVAGAAGLGLTRVAWALAPIASSLRIWAIYAVGFSFLAPGLVETLSDVGSVNIAEVPRYLLSPLVLGCLFVAGALALFASRFLAHQVRHALRERPAARSLAGLAGALLASGLLQPELLRAGGYCALGVVLVVVEDLMRPRELVE